LKVKIKYIIFSIILSLLFATAFIRTTKIYNGLQSTWYFYFFAVASVILIIVFISLISFKSERREISRKVWLNLVDLFVILFLVYSFFRLLITENETLNNSQFLTLLYLTLLYFVWKLFLENNLVKQNKTILPVLILLFFFLLSGLIEAFLGLLQLYNIIPGYIGSYFKVNGTFVNPDHLAGYLASVIPFSFGIYKYSAITLSNEKSFLGEKKAIIFLKYLALITFLTSLFILPSLKIRSSWLAVIAGIALVYFTQHSIKERINKSLNNFIKKGIAILLVVILAISIIIILYQLKPASADGRLLIWKITGKIINENPIWGIGFNRYASEYGNYQADYFNNNLSNDYEKLLAGNVKQAHNEFIQIIAELGIIGLVLWLGIIVSALWKIRNNDLPPPSNSLVFGLKHSARASLFSLLIVSIFSFPLHVLPTYINFMFMISILSAVSNIRIVKTFEIPYYMKAAAAFAAIIILFLLIIKDYKFYNAYKIWNDAYQLASHGLYNDSAKKFEKVYPELKTEGEFLFNYGGVLLLNNKYRDAAVILEESKNNYLDPKQYINLGICYENLDQGYKAEQHYRHAINMEPNKIFQNYLLTQFYVKGKKYELAKIHCQKILDLKIKIETTAAQEIKKEAEKLMTFLNYAALSGN